MLRIIAMTGFAMTGFAMTGFAMTGFAMTGLAMTGLALSVPSLGAAETPAPSPAAQGHSVQEHPVRGHSGEGHSGVGAAARQPAAQDSPAQAPPVLEIVWPRPGSVVELGEDADKAIGVVVRSNFALLPAGRCGGDARCGHVHMKIDPDGDTCNIPGRPYNSMNSDFGGDLVKARFGHCPDAAGRHVIGVLLADDRHRPVLVDGKPVTALVTVTTR